MQHCVLTMGFSTMEGSGEVKYMATVTSSEYGPAMTQVNDPPSLSVLLGKQSISELAKVMPGVSLEESYVQGSNQDEKIERTYLLNEKTGEAFNPSMLKIVSDGLELIVTPYSASSGFQKGMIGGSGTHSVGLKCEFTYRGADIVKAASDIEALKEFICNYSTRRANALGSSAKLVLSVLEKHGIKRK
jgi:hypothetical protein